MNIKIIHVKVKDNIWHRANNQLAYSAVRTQKFVYAKENEGKRVDVDSEGSR